MKLHDWIYKIVTEVCYDRDYLYACYVRHFTGLMNEIIEKGPSVQAGEYNIGGIKSNKNVRIDWQLERRLDWTGSNIISFSCQFESSESEVKVEKLQSRFDISTGDSC